MQSYPIIDFQILPFLKIFVNRFPGTMKARKLKVCINMDNDEMYCVYWNMGQGFITLGNCSSCLDWSKDMAARGQSLFSLYIYIGNFKIYLVRNHWTDFNITWQECFFGDPLLRFSSCHNLSKNMVTREQGLFSLYIYIENF